MAAPLDDSSMEQLTAKLADTSPKPILEKHRRPKYDEATATRLEKEIKLTEDVVAGHLRSEVPDFARLEKLRDMGWDNPAGDAHFKKQRATADNAPAWLEGCFYGMMQDIGEQLQTSTGVFRDPTNKPAPEHRARILDFCMAPGGFLSVAFKYNPTHEALAFSLSVAEGGHKVVLPPDPSLDLRLQDITMLAGDMGVSTIPATHPDASKLLPTPILRAQEAFDLVIADGQVLRTQARAAYREGRARELRRLVFTQLALGVEHLAPGGRVVALLHMAESWQTLLILAAFEQFASVRLYKPASMHATRSSLYMVATDVRSRSDEALCAVAKWKEGWRVATFGDEQEFEQALCADVVEAREVFARYVELFVEKVKPVWIVQADALEKAPWMRKRG